MTTPPVTLAATDTAADRPFTDPACSERDVGLLDEMLEAVRSMLRPEPAPPIQPYRRMAWKTDDGRVHRLVMCQADRLRVHAGAWVVGFFAERRTDVDITPLEEANAQMVDEFASYPGIFSYSSMQLAGGHWGNMVLHDDPVDTDYWRNSQAHAAAADLLSPVHYHNVRIHNAQLTGNVLDSPDITLLRTKYYDYSGGTEWRGERTLRVG